MAKRFFIFGCVIVLMFLLPGCFSPSVEQRLIRIHIRANSNSEQDQAVKLVVRDALNIKIKDIVGSELDYNTAYDLLEKNLSLLQSLAVKTLGGSGFSYLAKVSLKNEYFPTRAYGDIVVDSGYYDAVIVELGNGKGDNWWCVVYPPLCYVPEGSGNTVEYKSLISELWKKYFG